MSEIETTLRIPKLKPRFFLSVSMDSLTENKRELGDLLVTSDWHMEMMELNRNSTFLSKFTKLTEDLPNFPISGREEEGGELYTRDPEKRPINNTYFEKHPSISAEFNDSDHLPIEEFGMTSIIIRVFEHGAITARCRFESQENAERTIVDAVSDLRELRIRSRRAMYEAISEFIEFVDETYDNIDFSIPSGERAINNLERYEYIDTEFTGSDGISGININKIVREDDKLNELREIVGFCRMSKTYSWPNFPPSFLRSYMRQELGNREDELWFVTSQRFIRYFPDKDISETSDFIKDIVLAIEILLSLRAVYKTLLEDVRREVGHLPKTLSNNQTSASEINTDEIENIQAQISISSFRLARTHFPSNIRFYAQSPFATKVFKQIEKELQLPELAEALETEMEKSQGAVDSFGAVITHRRDIRLQRRILILTVVVGVAGALVGLGNLISSLI